MSPMVCRCSSSGGFDHITCSSSADAFKPTWMRSCQSALTRETALADEDRVL